MPMVRVSNGGTPSTLTIVLGSYGNNANNAGAVMFPKDFINNYDTVTIQDALNESGYKINRVRVITSNTANIKVGTTSTYTTLYELQTDARTPVVVDLTQYKSSYLNNVGVFVSAAQGNWPTATVTFS